VSKLNLNRFLWLAALATFAVEPVASAKDAEERPYHGIVSSSVPLVGFGFGKPRFCRLFLRSSHLETLPEALGPVKCLLAHSP